MKKLLSLISTMGILSTSVTSVVACNKAKDNATESDPINVKSQLEVAVRNGNILFTTKQNEKDNGKYFAVIRNQLIKLFDDAEIKYEEEKFKFETEFKEEWFEEAKEQVIESYIEIKDGFSFNKNSESLKIEKVKIKLIVEKIKEKNEIQKFNLGKFISKKDQRSIKELHTQIFAKNSGFGYNKDKVEIEEKVTDIKKILKDTGLKFDTKRPKVEDIKKQIKKQNQDININAIKLENINIDNHTATAVGDGKIYTGAVNLILKYDINLDIKNINIQGIIGKGEIPNISDVNSIVKEYNCNYVSEEAEFVKPLTAEKAIIKGKDEGFYHNQVEINYKYISYDKVLDIVKKAKIKVKLRFGNDKIDFIVAIRDYLIPEIEKEIGIIVSSQFGLGIDMSWSNDWTSREKHQIGDVLQVRIGLKIKIGYDELPWISGNEHPPVEITIVG